MELLILRMLKAIPAINCAIGSGGHSFKAGTTFDDALTIYVFEGVSI